MCSLAPYPAPWASWGTSPPCECGARTSGSCMRAAFSALLRHPHSLAPQPLSLAVCLQSRPSRELMKAYPSACLPTCLSTCLPLCLPACLPDFLPADLPACLTSCLSCLSPAFPPATHRSVTPPPSLPARGAASLLQQNALRGNIPASLGFLTNLLTL